MRGIVRLGAVIFILAAAADIIAAEESSYDGHGRRSPFLPISSATPGAGMPGLAVDTKPLQDWFSEHLGGILWDPVRPHALIGDKIVSVDSWIKIDKDKKCKIVEIKPESIVFEYMNQRAEVTFKQEKKEILTDENE